MSLEIEKKPIKDFLILAGKIVKGSELSILSTLKVEIAPGGLKLSGTNLKVWITEYFPYIPTVMEHTGSYSAEGTISLLGIKAFLQGPEKYITEEMLREFQFSNISADRFPDTPYVLDDNSMQGTLKDLKVLQYIDKCKSGDDSRYFMQGTYFEHSEDGLKLVATDGCRMACASNQNMNPSCRGYPNLIVGNIQFLKGWKVNNLDYYIPACTNQIVFQSGFREIALPTIEGQFPNYTRVIPDTFGKPTVVYGPDILNAFKEVKQEVALLGINYNRLPAHRVSFEGLEVKFNISDTIDVTVQNPFPKEFPVAVFTMDYLIDAFSYKENYDLYESVPERAWVIEIPSKDIMHVIMPLVI